MSRFRFIYVYFTKSHFYVDEVKEIVKYRHMYITESDLSHPSINARFPVTKPVVYTWMFCCYFINTCKSDLPKERQKG